MGILSPAWDDHHWEPRAYWSTRSKKDPRFNMDGGASGVFSASAEIDKAILAKEAELGCTAPDDIEIGAFKNDR